MEAKDVLKHSVTENDANSVIAGSGVIRFIVPMFGGIGGDANRIQIPPVPPAYWSQARDIVLRATIHAEPMWAAAVGIAITKIASSAWEVKSDVPLRVKKAQNLLLDANGRTAGWTHFISQHLRDYLTTDNGAFFEIIRSGRSESDPVVGLKHLDSLRCTRTGDPEIPVIYRDRIGKLHEMKSYQVSMLSDMPDPGDSFYGVGLCAASRAYQSIFKLAAIEWYLREKVSGQRPLAIHVVNGMLAAQIQDAVKTAQSEQQAKGAVAYMGAVIVGLPQDTPPNLVTIPLAEFPDRFNRKEEFDLSMLTYADALGLDPQDLQPLSGGGFGTGAQSVVLAEKASGRSLAVWRQGFTHIMNNLVYDDDTTTFTFVERDFRDQNAAADVSKKRAEIAKSRIEAGITTAAQEQQIMVDIDELPREMFTDGTENDALSDSEKPGAIEAEETEAAPDAEVEATQSAPKAPKPTLKETLTKKGLFAEKRKSANSVKVVAAARQMLLDELRLIEDENQIKTL